MGCGNSKDENGVSAQSVQLKVTDTGGGAAKNAKQRGSVKGRSSTGGDDDAAARRTSEGNSPTNKWSLMESAEESGFLRDGADDALDDLLEKEFPTLKSSRSNFSEASTWRALASEIPYETGDFVLKPPWTLAQAHAFYFFLCQTDERRRNKERNDDEPSIPKRCVYEMLTAAYEHYDARAHEHGALQAVPPPTSSKQKLKVCGDTHGQLQVCHLPISPLPRPSTAFHHLPSPFDRLAHRLPSRHATPAPYLI